MTRFRSLVVVEASPWGVPSGPTRHITPVLAALAGYGDVDVCIAGDEAGPPPPYVSDVCYIPPLRHRAGRGAALRAGLSLAPPDGSLFDGSATLAGFRRTKPPRYQLTWVYSERLEIALRGEFTGALVLDSPDVPVSWISTRLDAPAGAAFMGRLGRIAARKSLLTWRIYYREVARRAAAIAVCSEAERARLRLPRTFVVPNTYAPPSCRAGDATRGDRPWTVGFIGGLDYPPNRDAATWLAREIMPVARTIEPNLELRLAGRSRGWIDSLRTLPGVRVDGGVDDLTEWLSGCDVLAAPIRWGGGTRLKALEAFAHRIPLVTTAFGVDGLGVENGTHVLMGESPSELASQISLLRSDAPLRRSLVDQAEAHYLAHFTPDHAIAAVQDVLWRSGISA